MMPSTDLHHHPQSRAPYALSQRGRDCHLQTVHSLQRGTTRLSCPWRDEMVNQLPDQLQVSVAGIDITTVPIEVRLPFSIGWIDVRPWVLLSEPIPLRLLGYNHVEHGWRPDRPFSVDLRIDGDGVKGFHATLLVSDSRSSQRAPVSHSTGFHPMKTSEGQSFIGPFVGDGPLTRRGALTLEIPRTASSGSMLRRLVGVGCLVDDRFRHSPVGGSDSPSFMVVGNLVVRAHDGFVTRNLFTQSDWLLADDYDLSRVHRTPLASQPVIGPGDKVCLDIGSVGYRIEHAVFGVHLAHDVTIEEALQWCQGSPITPSRRS